MKLLRALVLTKETLAAQSEKYERICSENVDLQSKLVQAGRSGAPCNISGHSSVFPSFSSNSSLIILFSVR